MYAVDRDVVLLPLFVMQFYFSSSLRRRDDDQRLNQDGRILKDFSRYVMFCCSFIRIFLYGRYYIFMKQCIIFVSAKKHHKLLSDYNSRPQQWFQLRNGSLQESEDGVWSPRSEWTLRKLTHMFQFQTKTALFKLSLG